MKSRRRVNSTVRPHYLLAMEEVCTANFRWTREELVRAMQNHQRVKLRRGVVLIMMISSAVLLLFIGLLLVAWLLLPSTSAPPIWAIIVLAAFSLYCFTFDLVHAWYWSLGFNTRRDANVEINLRFSDAEITIQSSLGTATVGWKSFFRIVGA